MFDQAIRLITEKENKQLRISVFILKILFTSIIATSLYKSHYGTYTILPLDYVTISTYLINGEFLPCVVILYVVWFVSFSLVGGIIDFVAGQAISYAFPIVKIMIKNAREIHERRGELHERIKRQYNFILWLYERFSIIEVEGHTVRQAAVFKEFRKTLAKIAAGKTVLYSKPYRELCVLILQASYIYIYSGFQDKAIMFTTIAFFCLISVIYYVPIQVYIYQIY